MKRFETASTFSRISILGIAVTAILAMYRWMGHDIAAPKAGGTYVLMLFNTALLFLISCAGFIHLDRGNRKWAMAFLLALVMFTLVTFLQYPLHVDFGIDTLFIAHVPTGQPNRLPPITLLSFGLVGSALLLCCRENSKNKRGLLAAMLFGNVITALGIFTALAHISGLDSVYLLNTFARMAPSTAICFILMGINTVIFVWKKLGGMPLWMPLPIYIGLVTITFLLAQLVRANEEIEFQRRMQANAEAVTSRGELYLDGLYNALERMKERWIFDRGTLQKSWENDATNYVHHYPFINGLSRTDSTSRVLWVEPEIYAKKIKGFQLNSEPRRALAFAQAIDTRTAHVTSKIALKGGGIGFLYINPLFVGDRFDGSLVASIQYDKLFNILLTDADKKTFYLSIYENGELLYSNLPPQWSGNEYGTKTAALHNKDSMWMLTISPTQELLDSRNPTVPWIVLGVGLLTSFLVGISILLSIKGRQDNLELQKTSADLEASNLLSTAILASSSYMIIAIDISGTVIVFNREAEQQLGYSARDVLYKATPALWHSPQEMHARAQFLSMELGEPVEESDVFTKKALLYGSEQSEWEFIRQDGSRFPALLSVTPLKDAKASTVGYLGIAMNITRRKKQEEALRSSEESFRNTIEHASIGMALVSPEGKWLQVNNALCKLLGYSEEEMINADFRNITHPDDLEENLKQASRLLNREVESYQLEKRYFHKDGHIIWVLANASMVWYSDGTPKNFIAQIQDITESKKSRHEMEALVDKLLAANEELEQFAYVASHDLQEPLRMVVSFTDLIREEYESKLDAEGKEYIQFAIDAARRMQHMISDLLEYARIDNKAESMVKVDAQQQLNNVLGNLHGIIVEKNVSITHDPLPDIQGNPVRFMRLLQNLVGNAMKYQKNAHSPVIHIGVQDKGNHWLFYVRDNGIGIAPEYIDTIFLPFERLHSNEEYQGSGIGLAICRKIVESHGGTIWAESQPDMGSTFYFTVQKSHERK